MNQWVERWERVDAGEELRNLCGVMTYVIVVIIGCGRGESSEREDEERNWPLIAQEIDRSCR